MSTEMTQLPTPADGYAVGPAFARVQFTTGIRGKHVFAYVLVTLTMVMINGLFPILQPFLLSEHFHIPKQMLGRVGGSLLLTQNITVFALTIFFGVLCDRIGSSRILALGCFGFALGAFLYPLMPTFAWLLVIMVFVGASQTGQLIGGYTVGIRAPSPASRGKYNSFMSVLQTIAVALFVAQLGVRLPRVYAHFGATADHALRYSYWTAAFLGIPAGIIALRGLEPFTVRNSGSRTMKSELRHVKTSMGQVFHYVKKQPRFRLVMVSALLMRGDFAVVTTFLSSWVTVSARERGITTSAAVSHTGSLYFTVLVSSLFASITAGFVVDRLNRIKVLLCAMAFAAVAYATPLLVTDIFAKISYLPPIMIGLAEGFIIVSHVSLLGDETPLEIRGAVVGVLNLLGIMGVALVNYAGGVLFDKTSHAAPFVMLSVFNLLAFAGAAPLARSARRMPPIVQPAKVEEAA